MHTYAHLPFPHFDLTLSLLVCLWFVSSHIEFQRTSIPHKSCILPIVHLVQRLNSRGTLLHDNYKIAIQQENFLAVVHSCTGWKSLWLKLEISTAALNDTAPFGLSIHADPYAPPPQEVTHSFFLSNPRPHRLWKLCLWWPACLKRVCIGSNAGTLQQRGLF